MAEYLATEELAEAAVSMRILVQARIALQALNLEHEIAILKARAAMAENQSILLDAEGAHAKVLASLAAKYGLQLGRDDINLQTGEIVRGAGDAPRPPNAVPRE